MGKSPHTPQTHRKTGKQENLIPDTSPTYGWRQPGAFALHPIFYLKTLLKRYRMEGDRWMAALMAELEEAQDAFNRAVSGTFDSIDRMNGQDCDLFIGRVIEAQDRIDTVTRKIRTYTAAV